MSDVVMIDNGAAFTQQEGTISGQLEVTVEDSVARVRYAGNPTWLTIPGDHGDDVQSLAAEIGQDRRNEDGNRIPFGEPQ